MHRRSTTVRLAIAGSALAIGAVGLVGSSAAGGAAKAHLHTAAAKSYYLSLGDSYSVGYQPAYGSSPGGNTKGYTAVVAKAQHLTLVNFGCGGATTSSILNTAGCSSSSQAAFFNGWNSGNIANTQEANGLAFIDAHPGQVKLVTVSISGNDVTSCAQAANPITCVLNATTAISTNVGQLVSDLDAHLTAAGDTNTLIVGTTYPDVLLGLNVWPSASPNNHLAGLSTVAFDLLINPTLNTAYTAVSRGRFVNVTNAPYTEKHGKWDATSGMDTNAWDATNNVFTGPTYADKTYGTIPVATEEVCSLTFYCSLGNIHANTTGYKFIGALIDAKIAAG